MEGELEQIPSQCGVAILDLLDGKVLKLTGDFDNEVGRTQCERLYRIILVLLRVFLLVFFSLFCFQLVNFSLCFFRIVGSVLKMIKFEEYQFHFFLLDTL